MSVMYIYIGCFDTIYSCAYVPWLNRLFNNDYVA